MIFLIDIHISSSYTKEDNRRTVHGNLTNALSMSNHSSHTPGNLCCLRSILSNKWLHDAARQDVVHLFNRDLPKWLEAAYTALYQHLQTQGSKCDWSVEITCPSHAVIDRCRINFSGSQGIILDSANQQLLYYKTKDLPELHALQCTNAHPLEAF